MQITREDFLSIINQTLPHLAGMHRPPQVHKRIKRFYCLPLTTAGKCPLSCGRCREPIEAALKRVDPSKAKAPYAVFVWALRSTVAEVIEKASDKCVEEVRNEYGEKVEIDPLDVILETLEVSGVGNNL